ncbi:MAG: hypothetical protein L3J96_02280, partial [Thermoplasmata archaeon]|nr:hypothetical protein [Thermoplasmata archaeon]
GIIFSLIVGIILVLAYIKYDAVINWQRSMGQGGQPGWGAAPVQQAPAWGQPQAQAWGQPSMGAQPSQSTQWSAPPSAQPAQPGAWSQPAQPAAAPMAATAPAQAPATCPRCNKPATWVAQYNRWYCYSCAQYV